MINIENIKKKPLHDLLVYREALLSLIDKYEKMLVPRYSRTDMFDKISEAELRDKGKLSILQGYLSTLMLIIEEKTLKELEGQETITSTKTKKKTNGTQKK